MKPYPTYFNQPGAQATHPEPPEPRGRGARPYTGAKRGRKPRGAGPTMTSSSTRPDQQSQPQTQSQLQPQTQPQSQPQTQSQSQPQLQPGAHAYSIPATPQPLPQPLQYYPHQPQQSVMMPPPQYTPLAADKGKGKDDKTPSGPTLNLSTTAPNPSTLSLRYTTHQQQPHPVLALGHGSLSMHGAGQSLMKPPMQMATAGGSLGGAGQGTGGGVAGDDEDDADELPVMSDDVYGQGLLWQSQSKDNLKVLMDNFTPEQFERYEAYRRSALPKQSVRKVIQQSTNYTISQPVAQIVAGFAKVFVGEVVEIAREVQARMGEAPETPLSPEHFREAYRLYQDKTGKVGAARVHRGKKLFVR